MRHNRLHERPLHHRLRAKELRFLSPRLVSGKAGCRIRSRRRASSWSGRSRGSWPCCSTGESRAAHRDAPVRPWSGWHCGGGPPLVVRAMTWLVLGPSIAVLVLALLLRRYAQKRLAALDVAGEVVYWDDGTLDR